MIQIGLFNFLLANSYFRIPLYSDHPCNSEMTVVSPISLPIIGSVTLGLTHKRLNQCHRDHEEDKYHTGQRIAACIVWICYNSRWWRFDHRITLHFNIRGSVNRNSINWHCKEWREYLNIESRHWYWEVNIFALELLLSSSYQLYIGRGSL